MLLGGAVASVPFFRLRMCCFFPSHHFFLLQSKVLFVVRSACGSFFYRHRRRWYCCCSLPDSISPSLFHFNFFVFFPTNVHLGFLFIVVPTRETTENQRCQIGISTPAQAKCELSELSSSCCSKHKNPTIQKYTHKRFSFHLTLVPLMCSWLVLLLPFFVRSFIRLLVCRWLFFFLVRLCSACIHARYIPFRLLTLS